MARRPDSPRVRGRLGTAAVQRGCAATIGRAFGDRQKAIVHLFTPANRFKLLAHEAVLGSAARRFHASAVRRLLNHGGKRL